MPLTSKLKKKLFEGRLKLVPCMQIIKILLEKIEIEEKRICRESIVAIFFSEQCAF